MAATLGTHLLNHQASPLIFRGAAMDWPAITWTPEKLARQVPNQTLRFRIGWRDNADVDWETNCIYEDATLIQFVEWLTSDATGKGNPLEDYSPTNRWSYCDYKHMAEEFGGQEEMLKAVDWSKLGFPGRDGNESTFWLGSAGAHTQCHYDTYGANLVAQLYGRKQWVLFPPSQSEALYPTRIPYEESSVFSKIKVTSPNLQLYPIFKTTTPTVVTLDPGDVLYVPHHWWHDVTSLTTSVSVNTWIPLPRDRQELVKEAITRAVVMAVMADKDPATWLNPTEDLTTAEETMASIYAVLSTEDGVDIHSTVTVEGSTASLEKAVSTEVDKDSPAIFSAQSSTTSLDRTVSTKGDTDCSTAVTVKGSTISPDRTVSTGDDIDCSLAVTVQDSTAFIDRPVFTGGNRDNPTTVVGQGSTAFHDRPVCTEGSVSPASSPKPKRAKHVEKDILHGFLKCSCDLTPTESELLQKAELPTPLTFSEYRYQTFPRTENHGTTPSTKENDVKAEDDLTSLLVESLTDRAVVELIFEDIVRRSSVLQSASHMERLLLSVGLKPLDDTGDTCEADRCQYKLQVLPNAEPDGKGVDSQLVERFNNYFMNEVERFARDAPIGQWMVAGGCPRFDVVPPTPAAI